jgi:adenine-specific DNA-methyltransferase
MNLTTVTPKKSINKAFLKERVSRADMEQFKAHFKLLLDRIEAVSNESEENRKNSVSDFLKSAHFAPAYEINTKGREDLVIHTGKTAKDSVGVVFEIKKPDSSEMMTAAKPNAKALQQLVFYYLRERIEHKNLDIKHLIATDIFNWYIFDENLFDKHIYRNPKFQKGYETFKQSGKDTAFFYNEVAKPLLDDLGIELECTHFNLKHYEKAVKNDDWADDTSLIALYKILSPTHLLKLPFANDSNSLDKNFYAELLHIIGLEEVKEGSKKLINRKAKPDEFSLLENTITKIENKGFSEVSNLAKMGGTRAEQTFSIALELCITWVNRILFLKLLEAQLISYHKGDSAYRFLNPSVIYDCDRLNKLFFEVLAEKTENRKGKVKTEFEKIPYLNSSLFERTELERKTIEINYLDDNELIPILSNTVLKDDKGKKRTGSLPTLLYLFEFLDAFDFASEGSEGIQDDKRTLINASVLGLIFEKINGYKDGSFFTPGFITMYMCRETIRRAVVQKFRDTHLAAFQTLGGFDDLKDAITDRKQANDIINGLKICDPAVGSGHFLVSALNEIIALKSDLGVLQHRDGSRVKHYKVEIQNDELIVTDEENGDIFQYTVNAQGVAPREVQQLQETLFHEKQLLIENCLFGVDINPNSVKICRLRLWIELLKNAYYITTQEPNYPLPITHYPLETLPNIDINIKQGNSLISRFKLDDDLSDVFKKQKFSYKAYRNAVEDYKNTNSKEAKTELLSFISDIKEQFQTVFHSKIKENKELSKFRGQLYNLQNQGDLFGGSVDKAEADRLEKLVAQFEQKVKDIKGNIIYRDAFEWRFEFPEVLDNDGGYLGFDVVIGNPPYGVKFSNEDKEFYKETFKEIHVRTPESFNYFIRQFMTVSKQNGLSCFIIPSSFLNQIEFEKTRELILKDNSLFAVLNLGDGVFSDVATPTSVIGFSNLKEDSHLLYSDLSKIDRDSLSVELNNVSFKIGSNSFIQNQSFSFLYNMNNSIIIKCYESTPTLKDIAEDVATGVSSGFDKAYVFTSDEIKSKKLESDLLKKMVIGGEINRYLLEHFSKKSLIYVTTDDNISLYPNIETELVQHKETLIKRREAANGKIAWYALNWARRKKLFDEPKILIRQTANRIMAAYDEDQWYCLKSGLIIQLPQTTQLNYLYLLGLLNSNLMDYLYKNLVNEENRIFPEVKPIQLFKLPIKVIDKVEQQPLITLVEEILAIKKATPSVSTAEKEGEIDRLVYGLYGLTAEEIGIVEGAVK